MIGSEPQDTNAPHIQPETQQKGFVERWCPSLHPTVLAPYFDVTTKDIKQRLLASLMPFNQKFYMEYQKKPDLYGPFWIIWTLVVVLTIAGNLSRWFEYDNTDKTFKYEISIAPISISLLFTTVIGVPMGLRFAMKCFGSE